MIEAEFDISESDDSKKNPYSQNVHVSGNGFVNDLNSRLMDLGISKLMKPRNEANNVNKSVRSSKHLLQKKVSKLFGQKYQQIKK